jgi:ubiquinone/menaquinone biosynthesis C-methylase UbiE
LFCGLRHVLDAGCGFGQWTLSLSGLNEAVSACDISPARISALQELALALGRKNIEAEVSSLEPLPYPDAHFDGVFCYSVLPLVGWREALREIHRVAKPGGVIYVNANAIGYYAIFGSIGRMKLRVMMLACWWRKPSRRRSNMSAPVRFGAGA